MYDVIAMLYYCSLPDRLTYQIKRLDRRRNNPFHENMLPSSSPSTLRHKLWQDVLDAAGPLEVGPACACFLRAWIAMGVERMTIAGRLGPSDLANARANIRAFVQLMKSEAVFLGQSDRLDKETLRAAHRRLERKGLLTTFTLWPFWPNEFVARD